MRHESVPLDDFEREIIKRLDGIANIDEITASLLEFGVAIQTGTSGPDESPEAVKPSHDELRAVVDAKLERFAQSGLLIS